MKFSSVVIVMLAALSVSAAETNEPVTVTVNAERRVGPVNRGLFSLHGYMQLRQTGSPEAMRSFLRLRPSGTDTRIETMINLMEPENDNDDPKEIDWSRMHPGQMLRFIPDTDAFMDEVDRLGMTPVILLDYNVPWLSETGLNNGPPKSNEEWAEFAEAAIAYLNKQRGPDDPIRFVEVWNEPNLPDFFSGTKEDYFSLFNTVADRLHERFPGIGVGGPALTPIPQFKPEEWLAAFIEECGSRADFLTHHSYGHPVEKIIADIRKWVGVFRKLPGKENARILITESDHWLDGMTESDDKLRYMLNRQFALLEVADLCRSFHHFSLLVEGFPDQYRHGLICTDGSVIYSTYWPYWLFRHYGGQRVACDVPGEAKVKTAASVQDTPSGRIVHVAVYNPTSGPRSVRLVTTGLGEGGPWTGVIGKVGPRERGIRSAVRPAGVGGKPGVFAVPLVLSPFEAASVTWYEGEDDDYGQPVESSVNEPWVELDIPNPDRSPGVEIGCIARLTNTTREPVCGTLALTGLPPGWKCEPEKIALAEEGVPFGESFEGMFEVTAATPVDGGFATLQAVLALEGDGEAVRSIPVRVYVREPVETIVVPPVVRTPARSPAQCVVRLINRHETPLEGSFRLDWPDAAAGSDETFRFWLARGGRYSHTLSVPGTLSPGTYKAVATATVQGIAYQTPIRLEVGEGGRAPAVPLLLEKHFNVDVLAWESKPSDFTEHSHAFPAEYFGDPGTLAVGDALLILPPTRDGASNAIEPAGEELEARVASAAEIRVLGYAVNGDKECELTVVDGRGENRKYPLRLSNWCTPPSFGETTVFAAPYRYNAQGRATPPPAVYLQTIPLGITTNVDKIVLPKQKDLYIFAISVQLQR